MLTERDDTAALSAGAICWTQGSTTGPFLLQWGVGQTQVSGNARKELSKQGWGDTFQPNLTCTRYCAKCFTCIISLHPPPSLEEADTTIIASLEIKNLTYRGFQHIHNVRSHIASGYLR